MLQETKPFHAQNIQWFLSSSLVPDPRGGALGQETARGAESKHGSSSVAGSWNMEGCDQGKAPVLGEVCEF